MRQIKFLCIILISILLFGCSYSEATLNINNKGDYFLEGYVVFSKDTLEQLELEPDECLDLIEVLNIDLRNGEHQNIEKIINGIQYKGISFKTDKELPIDIKLDDKFIPNITLTTKPIPKDVFNLNLLDDELSDEEFINQIGLKANITVVFPGEVESHSAGELIGINKVSLSMFDLFNGVQIKAASSFITLFMWIFIIVAAMIVFIIIYKKKKSQSKNIKNIIKYSDHKLLSLQNTNPEMAQAFKQSQDNQRLLSKSLRKLFKKRKH